MYSNEALKCWVPRWNKNKYTFPVKGAWKVDGNFDCVIAHRRRYVDEFAFDQLKFDENHKVLPYGEDMKEEDYPCYGEEITRDILEKVYVITVTVNCTINKFGL